MVGSIEIQGRRIGPGKPAFIVAELSANHGQKFENAVELIHAAREAGADAVKLQTYTPDTLTFDSDKDYFQINDASVWSCQSLYQLYSQAFTPWEWQPKLKAVAEELGFPLFSTAFDGLSVDFLETMNVSVHKIASCEIVDLPLIRRVAATGKPLILSTGMATLTEIEAAVTTARTAGARQLMLLKCTSGYPAAPEDMNLRTIPDLAERFEVPVGLSDHTLGTAVPIAAVTLGATLVEKHLTLSRAAGGPDSGFSLEPGEFKLMVEGIRTAELARGEVCYGPVPCDSRNLQFRRSLFVVEDLKAGSELNAQNVRSIRPAAGLSPQYYDQVLGRRVLRDVERGTPLSWDLIG